MATNRRYRLLCPIARALDRVGDRWTLLILRDLHAGPARFSDLQAGLTGIAANLLTDRLNQLVDDGLLERRDGPYGSALYALTDLGMQTRDLLFELAQFGGRFAPDREIRRPGNLRTVAVTLGAACQRVVTPAARFQAALVIDGEPFSLTVSEGKVDMVYAQADAPDVVMTTSYEPMIAAAEGEIALDVFLRDHVRLEETTAGKQAELMALLGDAMALFSDRAPHPRRV